jgi:predicted ATPase
LIASVLAEPILVGREHELGELQQALDSTTKGRGKTFFIAGEAGSGKTRLATEFLNRAKQKRITVISGWCISETTVPYFPFVEAFDTYFSPSVKEELIDNDKLGSTTTNTTTGFDRIEGFGITAWLAGPRSDEKFLKSGMLSPQAWKDQLFSAVAKTLTSISAQSPTILFIEDIHWADSASLALLHYISRVVSSEKILVLATYRSDDLTTDAEGRPHPLAEVMRQMRREDLFTEITLPSLNQTEVAKTVENMLGGKVQSELMERLVKESRGNSLFVVESIRMLVEKKSLVLENALWRLSVDEVGIPSKVKDIMLGRLGSLRRDQRRVLDAASVVGEKFDVDLLGAVLSQDSLAVLETLNDIAQSTSLVRCEEDYFRFDHSKSRETLYAEIPLALRKGYHGRIAEKLETKSKANRLPLSDLAYHYAQAGNKEKATKYELAAGQDALLKFGNAEAVKHFTRVIESIGEDPDRAEERSNALEGLGDAFYASSMFRESIRIFEELGNNAETDVARLRAFRKAMESAFQL